VRIVMFYQSLVSCWNHGNAHFLRGLVRELGDLGHQVEVYEPADGWSRKHMVLEHGTQTLREFENCFPRLRSRCYTAATLDLGRVLDGADLVMAHEWNEPALIARLGEARARSGRFRLLFHDTHHRLVSAPDQMQSYRLEHYDGVLAFGEVLTQLYLEKGLAQRAWTFHEAADTRVFMPPDRREGLEGDLVWVGNWGDDERNQELDEFVLGPVKRLGLTALVHGVRYPAHARAALARAGVRYAGWLPNHRVPEVFGRYRLTVHVPRRHYTQQLPGIPTIRVFEALAAGIPLSSSPWCDVEGLFQPGLDYLVARDGHEMERQLSRVLRDAELRQALSEHGRRTILERHTCAHRARELLAITDQLDRSGLEPERTCARTLHL